MTTVKTGNSIKTGISILSGAFAAALLLTACVDDNKPGDGGTLSQAQADTVAEVMAVAADGLAEGATFAGPADPSMDFVASAMPRGMPYPILPALCTPTRSPNPPMNGDADAVPDSVRVDFTGCMLTTPGFTIALGGMIDYVDPTPTTTDIGLKTRYLDFMRSVTFGTRTRAVHQNGVRLVIRSANMLQRADSSFHTDYAFPDGSTASHVLDWSSLFTPDAAGFVENTSWHGWTLPSGTWTINGTSTFTRGTQSFALTVTTAMPLHFDATCRMAPRFDAGSLNVKVVKN